MVDTLCSLLDYSSFLLGIGEEVAGPPIRYQIVTGPEGFEPSTSCSAGSHSIHAEL